MRPIEPPGTYSRKIERYSGVCSIPARGGETNRLDGNGEVLFHVETRTKIEHDVRMVQILQELNLGLERGDHALDALILLVREASRHLDLLDGDRFAGRHAKCDVNVTVRSAADQVSLDPLVRDCRRGQTKSADEELSGNRVHLQFSGSSLEVSRRASMSFI